MMRRVGSSERAKAGGVRGDKSRRVLNVMLRSFNVILRRHRRTLRQEGALVRENLLISSDPTAVSED